MGSINRLTLAISDKLRENCSREELKEIEAWVKRYQIVDGLKRQYAALTLPEQIAAARQWFESAKLEDARLLTDDILTAMAQLRRTLNRRELL